MSDVGTLRLLERNLSYGKNCDALLRDSLYLLGKMLLQQTTKGEKRNDAGMIVVESGFKHSHILAEKLCILREVLSVEDKEELTKTLRESELILIQDVFGSIGIFQGNENDVKDYLKRQKCGYGGNTFLKADRHRDSNIDKVKMTLDIITGCKFYSDIIHSAVDFEKAWGKFPNNEYKLGKLTDDYDLASAITALSETRNALSAEAKKAAPGDASLKFGVGEVVRGALSDSLITFHTPTFLESNRF